MVMADKRPKTMIKRITMQGFKSFNRRVSVPLLEGFNVFCGPNGVGKSNVVDAICFVLGRTSAKSMRAGRLHELIFHGGNGKAGAKQAVITLYLDNTSRAFKYDDDEISITRKVNKKGVSVYKVNGRTTTRQKALELLASARIYPDGHNIIMQGDITHIIEMNPIERRGLIDEISGIAEYNDKKQKANRDMEKVDQKLREAEILISERYDRFKRLEQERNAATKFQNLQKQLALMRASLAHKKVQTFQDKILKIEQNIERKEAQSEREDSRIEKLESDIDQRDEQMRDIADKLIDMSKRVGEEKKVSELRSKMLVVKNQIDSSTREMERLTVVTDKLEALESRKAELTGQMPRAVRAILKLKLRGVHGVVSNLINVPEKHAIAVEVAGGRHLNDIIVEDDDVASYCIDFLKREKIGRATFLPLNKIRPDMFRDTKLLNRQGVVGVASKLIKYDTKYMRAMEFVFGRTLVVEDLGAARTIGIGAARMVTLEGDLIERSGAMVGGHYIRMHPKTISASSARDIEQYAKQRRDLKEHVELLKANLKDMEKELKRHAKSEATQAAIDIEKVRVSSEREMDDLRTKRKQAYERKLKVQNDLNKLNIEKAGVEAELKNSKLEVSQYGEMDYIDETIPALQKFIRIASDELQAIGLVNLKAIEEYDSFRSQFDEYKQKYEKVLEEKKAVIGMIEEIENKRMEVFYDCLKIVSRHFSNIFTKMTDGTASLELEDQSDLESGLMIQANPEGKRMLNIDSMSGGEKSLTALAFIFAIQNYKPAPFYILDEVDAALDKENSQKVAQLIKSLSVNEQIVMITHNDQTIKYGDRVYGMTMERGESKILGVELPKS